MDDRFVEACLMLNSIEYMTDILMFSEPEKQVEVQRIASINKMIIWLYQQAMILISLAGTTIYCAKFRHVGHQQRKALSTLTVLVSREYQGAMYQLARIVEHWVDDIV